MKRKTRFSNLIALRLGDEDLRQLETIADRERTTISAVIRRFIAEGFERQGGAKGRKGRKGRKGGQR